MAIVQKHRQDARLGAPAPHAPQESDRLSALRTLLIDNHGGERFPPATRFAIVAGGSAVLWSAIALAVGAALR